MDAGDGRQVRGRRPALVSGEPRRVLEAARACEGFLSEGVWNLAQDSAGGRIRFRTDSSSVGLRLEWPHPPGMRNMHFFGQSGVDLYVGEHYWGTAVPDKDAALGKVYEHIYFTGQPRVMRDITIYLALYSPVKALEIGLDPDSPRRPSPFRSRSSSTARRSLREAAPAVRA